MGTDATSIRNYVAHLGGLYSEGFLSGVTSVFAHGLSHLASAKFLPSFAGTDEEALASDWAAVGGDLRTVIAKMPQDGGAIGAEDPGKKTT
jgi:hypothetical protein